MSNNAKNKREKNKKRAKKLTYLKYQNIQLSAEVRKYMKLKSTTENQREHLKKLNKAITSCSGFTLYAYGKDGLELINNFGCGHKLCNICNWKRQKAVRAKYYNWFNNNRTLNLMQFENKQIISTNSQKKGYEKKGFEVIDDKIKYNLMHLTLTVPHTLEYGWKNSRFYFRELIQMFNYIRKNKEWKKHVYGGEYGVENTLTANGYHIHIHGLLMVKKSEQNRNNLHEFVFREWNRLTVDEHSIRVAFNDYDIQQICKGNKTFDLNFCNKLNPKGSTIMGLENIYYKKGNKKIHPKEWGTEEMMFAVMETISYHFKPKMFLLDDGKYDMTSIVELSPLLYKQQLYNKFGCLQKEKKLNVKETDKQPNGEDTDTDIFDELNEALEFIDEDTGEVLTKTFIVTNPRNIYFDKDDEPHVSNIQENKVIKINALSTRHALQEMNTMYLKAQGIMKPQLN